MRKWIQSLHDRDDDAGTCKYSWDNVSWGVMECGVTRLKRLHPLPGHEHQSHLLAIRETSYSVERILEQRVLANGYMYILLFAKMGLEVLEEYMFMADSKTFSRILIGFSAKWRLPWKPHYLFCAGTWVNRTETNIVRPHQYCWLQSYYLTHTGNCCLVMQVDCT